MSLWRTLARRGVLFFRGVQTTRYCRAPGKRDDRCETTTLQLALKRTADVRAGTVTDHVTALDAASHRMLTRTMLYTVLGGVGPLALHGEPWNWHSATGTAMGIHGDVQTVTAFRHDGMTHTQHGAAVDYVANFAVVTEDEYNALLTDMHAQSKRR